MQTKSILLSMFLAMTSMCMAQVRISTSDLNGTKWRILPSSHGYFTYTEEKEIWNGDNGASFSQKYYLTDQPIYSYKGSLFDHSKVGKGTKGCYMIIYNDKMDNITCYSIEHFDKKKGEMADKLLTEECFETGHVNHYIMIK